MFQRPSSAFIPAYKENAALQLVIATAVGFILYNFTRVTLIVFGKTWIESLNYTIPYIGLAPLKTFGHRWWSIFTYGWVHKGFFEWLSNAVWLYTFGSVVQMLVGYRQVIPLFIYGLLSGGVVCLLSQFIPGISLDPSQPYDFLLTATPGIMALMAGSLTLSPKFPFYLGDNFSIPLFVVAIVYLVLNVTMYAKGHLPFLMLSLGGALSGIVTMLFLKRGYRPGNWMYSFTDGINKIVTPNEEKLRRTRNVRRNEAMKASAARLSKQQRIDEILDKINQAGYASLTKEERELLQQESRSSN